MESVYATGTFVPLHPPGAKAQPTADQDDPLRSVRGLAMSEGQVVKRYASLVFEKMGGRQDETARVLKVNRKTVAARIDHAWLARRAKRRAR